MNDTLSNPKLALVLGATGGVGGALTEALLARGWTVRALAREPEKAKAGRDARIQWLGGDALDPASVSLAARGVSLIAHAVNPPGYRDWDKLVLPMLDNSMAAARDTGARILLPGNIYNYGPDAFPSLSETSPQRPVTRKGAIRVQMEARLAASGVPALVVRAGDFFGGRRAASTWFGGALVTPGRPPRAITYPGAPGVAHAWAYLPDLAQAMVELVERTPAKGFETYHFAGHQDRDGTQMIGAIRRALGRPDLPQRPFPWFLVPLLAPFVTMFREMGEMRYLWREPLALDNTRLVQALGREPHTPLDEAVTSALRDLGCLPAAPLERRTTSQALRHGA
jgi:nucleoside-diphosphate-sugar epimerase